MRRGTKIKYAGFISLVALILFLFSGCHLLKKSVTGKATMTEDENVVRKVSNSQPDWVFQEIRMTGKADEDGNRIGFMGTLKIERNKQINIVLRSTIGIEIARVYANLDSVWISSKMLNIKEKGDWKLVAAKIGYPVDFQAVQGIFVQSLFTSAGDRLSDLIENLVVKNDNEILRLVSNNNFLQEAKGIKYLNEFQLNSQYFFIELTKIRDIKGQWSAEVQYQYNKDNNIKKLELKGLDSERNFSVDINIIKKEIKDVLEFNFDKF
jgi:hypothetical protein